MALNQLFIALWHHGMTTSLHQGIMALRHDMTKFPTRCHALSGMQNSLDTCTRTAHALQYRKALAPHPEA